MLSSLYIDPGTGSMLFTIFIGIISAGIYFLRSLFTKLKFSVTGGRKNSADKNSGKLNYVIFSDSKRYWNVFKPVCDEFERRKIVIYYFTASSDDPALSEKYEYVKTEYVGEGNKAFARLNMMKAQICLSTTPGLDVLQWRRSKDIDYYVHIYHDVVEGLGYRMFGTDFYDSILLTGSHQEYYLRKLEELRHLPQKEMVITGSTYMDALKEKADCLEYRSSDTKLILLAPSWGPSSILNRFGEKIVDALIKTGYRIAIRPHPQTASSDPEMLKRLQEKYPDSDMLSWNKDNDNFDILSKADVLITDFSGIVFDFCFVFDKPVIYADTSLDLSPYDAAWIDEPLWRLEVLPKLGIKLDESHFDDLKKIIEDLSENDVYRKGREEVKSTAWHYIGEASVKTVDYLVNKKQELDNLKNRAK